MTANTIKTGSLLLKAIVAADDTNGIGRGGSLPWPQLKPDLSFFKRMTLGRAVIMGRKTWESIPDRFRPLDDRLNVIITTNPDYDPGVSDPNRVRVMGSVAKALNDLHSEPIPEAFIIGGASLYNHRAVVNSLDEVYVTRVSGNYCCDCFADTLLGVVSINFDLVWERHASTPTASLTFEKWVRKPQSHQA